MFFRREHQVRGLLRREGADLAGDGSLRLQVLHRFIIAPFPGRLRPPSEHGTD